MQKWDYLAFARVAGTWSDDRYDGRTVQERLSDFGKEGWELVSVCYDSSGYNYYLKRPVATRRKSRAKTAKSGAKSTK
jgi:hypothetical protein